MNENQIKSGALLSYIAFIIGSLISLVYTPFMLRKLGPSEYGLFALVNTTIAYLTMLDFGFSNSIVRYTAQLRAEQEIQKEQALHGLFLLMYLFIGAIAFLLSLLIIYNLDFFFSSSFSTKELVISRKLMWLASINLALSFPFSVFSAIIIAYERFVFAKVINLVRLIINPLLMVSVLTIGFRSVGMIFIMTVLNLIFNSVNLVYCKRHLHIKMRFTGIDYGLLKKVGVYSFYIFLGMLIDRLYWCTGQFLLGIYVGPVSVAIYAVGVQFITILYIPISSALSSLFLPMITRLSLNESGNQRISELFIRIGRLQFIILALILTGFALYGEQFLQFWVGPEYTQSYYVAIIMMVPLTVPLIQNVGISILQAKNMHAFRSKSFLIIAIINVVISIPLIKSFGPVGSAMGTALSLIVGQVIVMNIYYQYQVKLEITKFWIEILRIVPALIFSITIGYIIQIVFPIDHLAGFIVNVILYISVYSSSTYLFAMNNYEKKLSLVPFEILFKKFCPAEEMND